MRLFKIMSLSPVAAAAGVLIASIVAAVVVMVTGSESIASFGAESFKSLSEFDKPIRLDACGGTLTMTRSGAMGEENLRNGSYVKLVFTHVKLCNQFKIYQPALKNPKSKMTNLKVVFQKSISPENDQTSFVLPGKLIPIGSTYLKSELTTSANGIRDRLEIQVTAVTSLN